MDIRLLGPVEVTVADQPVALGSPRQRAVLAMLALVAPQVVSDERFVDGLWGEDPPDNPHSSLQVFVHGLRKALRQGGAGDPLLRVAPGYRLDVPSDTVDATRFTALHDQARAHRESGDTEAEVRALQDALALWRGPALADLRHVPFVESEVAWLEELHLLATEDLYDARLRLGQHDELVGALEALVHEHPMRERFWGQLMTALYRSDRQADALATYGRAKERLADELGIDPGQALQQLELAILRQDPELTTPPPSPRPGSRQGAVAPRPTARVPHPSTPTFGREELVATVAGLVTDPGNRAVTLTGPGGSGKSRVAVLATLACEESFRDGIRFLTSTELTEADQLRAEVLHALTGSDSTEELPAELEALVVLDNLEAVDGGGRVVAELIEQHAGLTVLTTSRLPLDIRAEYDVPVPPLPVPDDDAGPEEVAASPAVQMFNDRTRSVNPDLDPVKVWRDVADLCRFVDGFPLAIELAAGHTRVLPPARILASLDRDLDLLAADGSDLAPRQRSLAATIEWTFDRLDPTSRLVAERLALFERGFTVEAVEAMCDDVDGVLEALADLAKARVIRSVPASVEMRFVLLGTVRAFARHHLHEQPGLDGRRLALAQHFLRAATGWEESLDGPEGSVVLGRYADAAADLDATIAWLADHDQVSLAVELACSLTGLWVASGRLGAGLAACDRLSTAELSAAERARVHVTAGMLAYHLGDLARDERECLAALDLDGADDRTRTTARCFLAGALLLTDRREEGAVLARQALEEATAQGNYVVRVVSLSLLAIDRAIAGDFDAERARYEQRLEAVTERGDFARLADTLNTLAEIALDEEDPATAAAYAEESLAIAGSALPLERRDATITMARAELAQGNAAAARLRLDAALELADRSGQPLAIAQCLRVAACLASARGEHGPAVRGFSAAQAISPSPSGSDEPIESDLRAGLERARAALAPGETERAWLLGRTLPTTTVRRQLGLA